MLTLPPSTRVFVATKPADMRRSFDGLLALVRDFLGHEDPQRPRGPVGRRQGRRRRRRPHRIGGHPRVEGVEQPANVFVHCFHAGQIVVHIAVVPPANQILAGQFFIQLLYAN